MKRFTISVERRLPNEVWRTGDPTTELPWRWSVWSDQEVASGITKTKVAGQRVAMAVRKTLKMLGGGT